MAVEAMEHTGFVANGEAVDTPARVEKFLRDYGRTTAIEDVLDERDFITQAISRGATKKSIWQCLKNEGSIHVSYAHFARLVRSAEFEKAKAPPRTNLVYDE